MKDNEMSSESQEQQESTQEALDAANTSEVEEKASPAEVEPTVPLHAHTALRERAQNAEIAAAKAQGALEALQGQQVATATISPIDAEIARQKAEGIEEEDMQISPAVIKADKLYERNQVSMAAEADATRELGKAQVVSMNKSKGLHTDWTEITNAGDKLLSNGDLLDLREAGDNFGELAYSKCKAAIERAKPVTKTDAAPNKEQSELEAAKKAEAEAEAKKKEELASQDDLLKREIANPVVGKAFDL